MKTELCENFVTVADCRSITLAARELHIAQPALSSQIRALEDEYQIELFTRLPRSVQLTDAGQVFYRFCKSVLEMEANTRVELDYCRMGEAGVLKFGTTRSYPDAVIQAILSQYSQRYPRIHYELYERSSSELVDALETGVIECAAIRSAKELPAFVHEEVTLYEQFCVLCAEDSKRLPPDRDCIALTDLMHQPLSISFGLRSYIQERCAAFGFQPIIHSMNPSRHFILHWAKLDRAVALIPVTEGYFPIPEGMRCYRLEGNPLITKRVFLVKQGRKLTPAAAHLVELLHEMFPRPEVK